jgi:hypothetical protein
MIRLRCVGFLLAAAWMIGLNQPAIVGFDKAPKGGGHAPHAPPPPHRARPRVMPHVHSSVRPAGHYREPRPPAVKTVARSTPSPRPQTETKKGPKSESLAHETRPREPGREPRSHEPLAHVHRFAHFNERTREFSFDRRWWHWFVVYPGTLKSGDAWTVNYNATAPDPAAAAAADNAAAPPVLRAEQGLPTSPAGNSLAKLLDDMDVEHNWLSGETVDWKTGNRIHSLSGPASHAGDFVAAVCAKTRVPMLSPAPANFQPGRQHDWLVEEGKTQGWVPLGEIEGQLLANQGWLVIAAWKDTAPPGERTVSGLTAIVRPSAKSLGEIQAQGPHIAVAGDRNHNDIPLLGTFSAATRTEVVYLAHRLR